MIQFLIHILSVVFTAFLIGFILVWIQRKLFSKQPNYRFTYEFRVFTLISTSICSDEASIYLAKEKWKQLLALGDKGWQIVGIRGNEVFLQRETLHTS